MREPRALVFTDTFSEVNGVAGTMRRLAAAAAGGTLRRLRRRRVARAGAARRVTLPPDWSLPLPSYESLDLRFPLPTDVLDRVETRAART